MFRVLTATRGAGRVCAMVDGCFTKKTGVPSLLSTTPSLLGSGTSATSTAATMMMMSRRFASSSSSSSTTTNNNINSQTTSATNNTNSSSSSSSPSESLSSKSTNDSSMKANKGQKEGGSKKNKKQQQQQQKQQQENVSSSPSVIPAGPFRRVGNIFVVLCADHPFKFSWEVNKMLRDLRLEFKGQVSIVPDIPQTRKQLWRVRHIVRIDSMTLDEAKELIGVPEHIRFTDLSQQISKEHFGRGHATRSPQLRSKRNFMTYRRMRLRDILHRDQLELKLLEAKRQQIQKQKGAKTAEATAAAQQQ